MLDFTYGWSNDKEIYIVDKIRGPILIKRGMIIEITFLTTQEHYDWSDFTRKEKYYSYCLKYFIENVCHILMEVDTYEVPKAIRIYYNSYYGRMEARIEFEHSAAFFSVEGSKLPSEMIYFLHYYYDFSNSIVVPADDRFPEYTLITDIKSIIIPAIYTQATNKQMEWKQDTGTLFGHIWNN